ncbi:MAG TPA: hypothetical protein VEB60_01705, partial [Candidatus Paceibacterota bacterium]|nr:hypothetical protein [Candidatus Paceibacterota bacterium]
SERLPLLPSRANDPRSMVEHFMLLNDLVVLAWQENRRKDVLLPFSRAFLYAKSRVENDADQRMLFDAMVRQFPGIEPDICIVIGRDDNKELRPILHTARSFEKLVFVERAFIRPGNSLNCDEIARRILSGMP